jgi:signal transduction histidine kinase
MEGRYVSRIAALCGTKQLQRLPTDLIKLHHQLLMGDPAGLLGGPCDLIVVDIPTLRRYYPPIAARRARGVPVLLLLTPEESRIVTPELRQNVDDTLILPHELGEFDYRVQSLLRGDRVPKRAEPIVSPQMAKVTVARTTAANSEEWALTFFASGNPYPVLRAGADGTIVYANSASSRLLDMWPSSVGGELPDAFAAACAECLQQGSWRETEIEDRGRTHTVLLMPVPGVKEALLWIRDDPEGRAEAREALQAQTMAAVGRLAGGVAFALNNLLTTITGYADAVQAALPAAGIARQDMDHVLRAADRAARLTQQLLSLEPEAVNTPSDLDINELLQGMAKMLSGLMRQDVHLQVELTPDVGLIKADPVQIEQVCSSLVALAHDAMPQGGVLTMSTAKVRLDDDYVRCHFGAQPGEHVALTISDTGAGLSETALSHLFEPFTGREVEGTEGLGLATVFGIVRQHQGHMTVDSREGQGTTFRIYLPLIDEPDPPAPQEAPLPAGQLTVLVAEDDAPLRKYMARCLRLAGFAVLEASDGTEAVEMATNHPGRIDLLLTDVVMPGMNADEVTVRVRGRYPHMRVLYTSGHADMRALNANRAQFLQKPFTRKTLELKVRQILGK